MAAYRRFVDRLKAFDWRLYTAKNRTTSGIRVTGYDEDVRLEIDDMIWHLEADLAE